MKKMVYAAICEENNGGDSWDLIATFNKAEAIKAAKGDIAHMVPAELKRRTVSVQGYKIDVEDGATAAEAWREYNLNGDYVDPVEYEVIK